MGESSPIKTQPKGDCSQEIQDEARTGQTCSSPSPIHKYHKAQDDSQLRAGTEGTSELDFQSTVTDEGPRPPLPPRPRNPELLHPGGSLQRPTKPRPSLQSTATTALSFTDANTQSFQDGSRERCTAPTESTTSTKSLGRFESLRRFKGWTGGDGNDSASMKSFAPTVEAGEDVESLLGEVLGAARETPTWKLLSSHANSPNPFDLIMYEEDPNMKDFEQEFDELGEIDSGGDNEGIEQTLLKIIDLSLIQIQRTFCPYGKRNESISSFCLPRGSLYIIGMVMIT
jgi:hypothetical protein